MNQMEGGWRLIRCNYFVISAYLYMNHQYMNRKGCHVVGIRPICPNSEKTQAHLFRNWGELTMTIPH